MNCVIWKEGKRRREGKKMSDKHQMTKGVVSGKDYPGKRCRICGTSFFGCGVQMIFFWYFFVIQLWFHHSIFTINVWFLDIFSNAKEEIGSGKEAFQNRIFLWKKPSVLPCLCFFFSISLPQFLILLIG